MLFINEKKGFPIYRIEMFRRNLLSIYIVLFIFAGFVMLSPDEQCKGGAVHKVFSKPDNCAQFYDCSLPRKRPEPGYLGDYIAECPYPKLFSEHTNKCEDFKTVNCGSRKEIKYACNYKNEGCPVAACRPCVYRFPDCRGLSDGFHVWKERAHTSYYAHCFSERGTGMVCAPRNGRERIFSPVTRRCV